MTPLSKLYSLVVGQQIGEWTVLAVPGWPADKGPRVACRCSCGHEQALHWCRLRDGKSTACARCSIKARVRTRFDARHMPEPNSGCWLWTGAVDAKGYGLLQVDDASRRAHRLAWELHRGPIPASLHVLHKCDVPSCVNPDHLFLGTNDDNVADKVAKRRQARGHGKLTEQAVIQIIALRGSGRRTRDIGADYGIAASTVSNIWHGRIWGHAT